MGYRTPNIDRIAKKVSPLLTTTASRAARLDAQLIIRPESTPHGHDEGRHARFDSRPAAEDPTIAELLKPLGYVTGQFGKNHLGDRNEYLPTARGFDEFFSNSIT